jgi:hypothetical protein
MSCLLVPTCWCPPSAAAAAAAQGTVQVLVDKESAADVYNMRPDDMISAGPFEGTGLDMRSSGVLGVFR